ncbi:MAG: 50S ribosomal protein L2 [Candidatus Aenigmarchaeota archaeon]|nr:50S ribosomal protein L2 [Candidatus Aenigmarchaeota archaeon]
MGKRIIPQARGKGGPSYRVPSFRKYNIIYRQEDGVVMDLQRDVMRTAPLARVKYPDRSVSYIIAPEGLAVGERTGMHVKRLQDVPEGSSIFAIETYPNSGPKLCRTAGSAAVLVSKGRKECIVQLPSKKQVSLHLMCRATLGKPAGDGFKEKPWVKGGKKWHVMHKRGKLFPRSSGVAMNAVDHPFGGGYTGLGKHKSISRNAPPGRKVGSISPRRSGRKKA